MSESAKDAVAAMAQKMRDLQDPTKHVIVRALLLAVVLLTGHRAALALQAPPVPAEERSGPSCVARAGLPDANCTPGAADPRVTQDNITTTICVQGYSGTVRPPVRITNRWKADRMAAYGETLPARFYESDHLISIEIGGDPGATEDPATHAWTETDWQDNLWPQLWTRADGLDARRKDALENELHRLVCEGQMPLAQAQTEIATDWVAAYRQYVSETP